MSDAALLAPVPIVWRHGGKEWLLAPRDNDAELFFQSRHEAWAIQHLDARRGLISDESYQMRLAAQTQAMDANRFAFGGQLSLEWLTTREGMVEYVLLLMQKGQLEAKAAPMARGQLDAAARSGGPEWDGMVRQVIRRDFRAEFPKLIAAWDGEDATKAAAP